MSASASPRTVASRVRAAVRAFLLSDEPSESFWNWRGVGRPTLSGVAVTDQTALRVTAVLSCVKVLAESISTLPLMVFERQANGDKRAATEHPLSSILHALCNEEATAQSVRETLCAHVLLRGNAYARVVRDGGGDVREIWPISPNAIQPERPLPGGPLVFRVCEPGVRPETLRADQVWWIPGLSWGGAGALANRDGARVRRPRDGPRAEHRVGSEARRADRRRRLASESHGAPRLHASCLGLSDLRASRSVTRGGRGPRALHECPWSAARVVCPRTALLTVPSTGTSSALTWPWRRSLVSQVNSSHVSRTQAPPRFQRDDDLIVPPQERMSAHAQGGAQT